MKILNLDDFKVEINKVVLFGAEYKIPSQIPLDLMLELMNNANDKSTDGMVKSIDVLHRVFQIYQPDLKYSDFKNMMNLEYFTMIMNFVMAGIDAGETKKMLDTATKEATGQKKTE